MGKKWRVFMALLAFGLLCMLPRQTLAADLEADWNANAAITIQDAQSYAVTGGYAWLKYVAPANGYLTVRISNPEGATAHATGYLALYNSAKSTVLSSRSVFYNAAYPDNAYWNAFTFGLQKGQTYYLRIKGDNGVRVSRKFQKVKEAGGVSKAKAVSVKKNKKKAGVIFAGSSNADWYAIRLTKRQKLRLRYTVKANGGLKISIFSVKQQIGSRNVYTTTGQKKMVLYQYLPTSKKTTGLEAGTYYVKVERADSGSSGYYTLKWN